MPEDIKSDPAFKQAVKEAIDEWLTKQFATFGRWTFLGLCSVGLSAFVYLVLIPFLTKK